MKGKSLAIFTAYLYTTIVFPSLWGYPTIERAEELFSSENISNQNIDFYRDKEYNEFLNLLWKERHAASEEERFRMKKFFLSTLTSIVVRVSTNAVDEGTTSYAVRKGRGDAFSSALRSFGDSFRTNVTDCFAIASYIDRVRPTPFVETVTNRLESIIFITKDAKKREEWQRRRKEKMERERPILELQRRVKFANDNVRDYRRALFDLCNACVLANRRLMDDEAFAAFTNRVVELSKPDETESKFYLFNHLDEVRRRSP